MARSTYMVIPEVTQAEGIRQFVEKVDIFNAASGGAIVLNYDREFLEEFGGDYVEPIKFARPSGVDRHTDEADPDTASTAIRITQAKGASVHQARHAYLKWTRDEVTRGKFKKSDYSAAVGEFIADDKILKLRNNLIAAGVAAIDSMDTPSANYHILDVARDKVSGAKVKATMARLNTLLGKMKDAREQIVTFVMPSAIFTDLVGDTISNYKMEKVAGVTFYSDVVQCFGRKVMVADIPALESELTSSYYTEHAILGLGVGALQATVISEDGVDLDTITTTKVKYWTARQDYDVEFAVQGMKWTTVKTNINPTDTELATAARWDECLSDHRECKIVKGIFNAT